VSEICRSFAFNISLQDGISSTDLRPTIVWDCVLVLVSIFVATLPAIAKMIERSFEYIQRYLAPILESVFVATFLKITRVIERVFEYFQSHQAPDLEIQTLAGREALWRQSNFTSSVGSEHLPPPQPPVLQCPDRAYQGPGDNSARSSTGGASSYDSKGQIFYHAI